MSIRGALVALLALPLLAPLPAMSSPENTDPAFARAIEAAKVAMVTSPAETERQANLAAGRARLMKGADRSVGLATADWLLSEAKLRTNQTDTAASLLADGIRRLRSIGNTSALYGNLLVDEGWLASKKGQTTQALSYYQEAHRIFLKAGDNRSRAKTLIAIAIIYDEAFDYRNALKYYEQALEAFPGDKNIAWAIRGNMGQALKDAHRLIEAEVQTRAALGLARQISRSAVTQTLDNLARIHLLLGKLPAADRDLAEAARLVGSDDDRRSLLATAAQAALQHGRVQQAVGLIDRSFAGIDLTKTLLGMRERHQTAYAIYSRAGNDQSAIAHLAAVKRLDDEATRLATSTNAALMGARFDFANQELRIAKLKAEDAARTLEFERARARTQQMVFIGVGVATGIVMALLGVALLVVRRSRNKVARANVVLAETNDALGQALAAKTAFLATTSHEIRTPLNGILGMTQVMLADAGLERPMRERIGILHAAGTTMRALVDDILDVAKMETGQVTIEMAPLDLGATLRELTRLWDEQARGKGLTFEADLAGCPATIEGDAARLRQIVFNLLANAIKFTPSGGVGLRAWAAPGADRYRIAVWDTGVGIPADKRELIFESFRQADTSTTRRFGGTGLGLAISRQLARAMDGDVTVEPRDGGGTVFTVDLPLVAAIAPEPVAVAAAVACHSVTVIERNPITRSTLRALLEPAFGAVSFVASLGEAVALLGEGRGGCVLADDATLRAAGPLEAGVAQLAQAAGLRGGILALLWTPAAGESREGLIASGANRVLVRPIAKTDLARAAFGNLDYSGEDLVPQAA